MILEQVQVQLLSYAISVCFAFIVSLCFLFWFVFCFGGGVGRF